MILAILIIAFLALHLVAAYFPGLGFWGADMWSYYPVYVPAVLILIGIALTSGKLPGKAAVRFGKIGDSISKYPFWLLVVIAGVALFSLSQSTFFLGDGYLRLSDTQRGVYFSGAEPLDTFLHNIFYTAANSLLFDDAGSWFTGDTSYRIISILCALGLLLSLKRYGNKLFPENPAGSAWIIGLLLFTAGFSQMFFGYVESYTIVTYSILLFLLSSIHMIKSREYSLLPSLFCALSILLHPVSAILLPSLFYAYSKVITERKAIQYAKPAILIVILTGLLLGLFTMGGLTPSEMFNAYTEKSRLLPLFAGDGSYGILSPGHLFDIFNQVVLAFPAVFALPLLFRRSGSEDNYYARFLLIVSLLLFVPLLAVNPELGFARDWDLFSLFSIPLTLWVGLQLVNSKENRLKNTYLVVIVCLLHTAPWIGVNASEAMSVDRAERLAGTPYWSGYARSLLYNDLSEYYYKKKNYEKAFTLIEKSYENEKNPRFLYTLGCLAEKTGKTEKAESSFQLLSRDKKFGFQALSKLINIYMAQSKYQKAESALKQILLIDNKEPKFHFMLGVTYIKLNRFDDALQAFADAKIYDTGANMAIASLAEAANNSKNYDEAEKYYRILLVFEPKDPILNFNLATIYFYTKRYDLAEEYIRVAESLGFDRKLIGSLRNDILRDTIGIVK